MSGPAGNNSFEAWSTTANNGSQAGSAPSGRDGSRAASQNGSAPAPRANAAECTWENVGLSAAQSNTSASERAANQQRNMGARLERIAAPLGVAAPPPANQDATYLGEGMLNDLEEIYQAVRTRDE